MSASILEELFVHLQRVPAEDLEFLDDEHVDWLPRIRILRPQMAIQEIRRAVEASPNGPECRLRVAWLYCWLLSRQKICPWLLIRFHVDLMEVDIRELMRDLASALQSNPRRHTTIRVKHERGTYYACLINNYADPAYRQCRVMFLVLWHNQRFAAAYAGTNEELRALTTALHVALRGERVEMLLGLHADLDAAYSAGCQDVAGTCLFRSDSSTSNLARLFWHFD
ncbi:hypothetical protein HPB52_001493 [Rhipicephalus sanguineus]|uniref:Uncharacterized protein n=1 Tax=Rhipicephalus sanguineus TaxID=34632 RepID=A0A9D4SPP3_RHISA|nr:hypothetical protein HPB52_001493 [Rhipicephalus sanguineus]